ncbi:MAG TPA: tetratricopeptide repeat protein, partial [Allocoleopsis sp.]
MMKKILTLWPKLQLNYLFNLVQKILAKINPLKWLLKPNSKLKLKVTPVKKLLVLISLTTCLTVTLNSVKTSVLAYTDQGNINRETTELITQEKSGKNLLESGKKLYQDGNFSEGIKVLKEAVGSFQKEKEQLGEAIALSNLSLTYQQIGEWEAAKNALTGSLEILN